jgi:hypothetical protein
MERAHREACDKGGHGAVARLTPSHQRARHGGHEHAARPPGAQETAIIRKASGLSLRKNDLSSYHRGLTWLAHCASYMTIKSA